MHGGMQNGSERLTIIVYISDSGEGLINCTSDSDLKDQQLGYLFAFYICNVQVFDSCVHLTYIYKH